MLLFLGKAYPRMGFGVRITINHGIVILLFYLVALDCLYPAPLRSKVCYITTNSNYYLQLPSSLATTYIP